ncbi:MAG: flagellar hook-basal body complex protein [Gemmatimonadales bacterium]
MSSPRRPSITDIILPLGADHAGATSPRWRRCAATSTPRRRSATRTRWASPSTTASARRTSSTSPSRTRPRARGTGASTSRDRDAAADHAARRPSARRVSSLTFTYPGRRHRRSPSRRRVPARRSTSPSTPGTIGDVDGLAGFSNASNAVIRSQDGYQSGDLESIAIDKNGVVTGFFTNGVTQALAQIALARFNNPSGLLRQGDNMFTESANSGLPVLGFAGTSDVSSITPGALENSNVDLSQEFTSMIITQRGFQANARVITTSDEMLQELVNLKR